MKFKFIMTIILFSIFIFCIPLLMIIEDFFTPNPALPKIIHGEFPISLEYEIDGCRIKVNDTLICDFDGFGFDEGRGKFRKWKAYLKSGKTRITLFTNDNIEIYYFPVKSDSRLAGVFMNDTEYYSGGTGGTFPDAWYTNNFEDKTVNDYIISADDMINNYNIKLINWEYAAPIKNTFN